MSRMIRLSGPALAIACATLLLVPSAAGADGDLDPDFGVGGKVTIDVGRDLDTASGVAIQPDGKIVAAGYSDTLPDFADFALARVNPVGSLDASFGTGGVAVTDFGPGGRGWVEEAYDVQLQADGKIVLAGRASNPSGVMFALARYNTDGSLDPSFGDGGKVTTDFEPGARASALAIQPDGKLVAAGSVYGEGIALARYNPDGSLDESFGDGGKVTTEFAGSAGSVLLQPDGRIVTAGSVPTEDGLRDFLLARFGSDGSLDPSFGDGGKVTTDFDSTRDLANDLQLQADGKLVAAGSTNSRFFALARYGPDGTLDPSFGDGGKLTTDISAGTGEGAHALAVQSDGKLVAAGEVYLGSGSAFALARYDLDGSLDPSFGEDGTLITDFTAGWEVALDLAIQSDGKLVAAGGAGVGPFGQPFPDDFALARYLSGPVDTTGTIVIAKEAVPDDAQDFSFSGSGAIGSFSLDDDADPTLPRAQTFADVPGGSYTVTELVPAGWTLTGIVCADPDSGSRIDLGAATATIDLDPRETVTCTFTDVRRLATCEGRPATIVGTEGDDVLVGTLGDDVIAGLDGNDQVDGSGGDDLICGDRGADSLVGGRGDDHIAGGRGPDVLDGRGGDDELEGGSAADLIVGGTGRDVLVGGRGENLYNADGGDDTVYSANGVPETVECDGGEDTVQADPRDELLECEHVSGA